jgi:hypothetical protein
LGSEDIIKLYDTLGNVRPEEEMIKCPNCQKEAISYYKLKLFFEHYGKILERLKINKFRMSEIQEVDS